MKRSLMLRCLDDRRVLEIAGVTLLNATDGSGQFGILPGHAPFLTVLQPGLLSYRCGDRHAYLATAGGPFYCRNDQIQIISTRFVQADDLQALMPALDAMKAEEGEARRSRQQHSVDITRSLVQRLKEWQDLK
ncbi:MAG TPA: F0F1 ATP synthase subunit epsilon [Pseudomonadales bacterium]|nr:F0F1 ATP synthase subunit epsilon [Pseudomonadales bacterium]